MEIHLVMYRWVENKIEEDPDFLDDIWFRNEAHFWLCRHVNSNNYMHWGAEGASEIFAP